jgi:hypothetical protein
LYLLLSSLFFICYFPSKQFRFIFVCVELEFELRVLHLQSRCSTIWATCSVLRLFWRWCLTNYLPGLVQIMILQVSASQAAGITGRSHGPPSSSVLNVHKTAAKQMTLPRNKTLKKSQPKLHLLSILSMLLSVDTKGFSHA